MIDLTEFFNRFQIGFSLVIIALILVLLFFYRFPSKPVSHR